MDARIPQTAAIDKQKASLNVEYDSEPQFEKITGTKMYWATNTETPVIRVGNTYYAVDEAVWFDSNNARGPWEVATSVPDEIYTIPSDSPVYNVTFVRIYDRRGGSGLRRLYAWLHKYLCLQRNHSLWHGLLLARLVWEILLSSLLDLGIPCSLEPLDWLGVWIQLRLRPVRLRCWSGCRTLVSWRLVGTRALRGLPKRVSSRISPRPQSRLPRRPTPPTHPERIQEQAQSGSCHNRR